MSNKVRGAEKRNECKKKTIENQRKNSVKSNRIWCERAKKWERLKEMKRGLRAMKLREMKNERNINERNENESNKKMRVLKIREIK